MLQTQTDTKHILPTIINSNKISLTYYRENARDKLEELLSQPLLPAEQQKVYEALNRFVALEFLYQLSKRYPIISDEIFNLEKEEKYTHDYKDYTVRLPVVVSVPLQSLKVDDVFKKRVKGVKIKDDDSYTREHEFEIECSIPELTPEARIAFSDAVKFSAELTAEAYKDKLFARILIRDRMYERALDGPLISKYHLVWAPSNWNIKLIETDPAIFMKYAGHNLLIYSWNIQEEKSLDSMLREFAIIKDHEPND